MSRSPLVPSALRILVPVPVLILVFALALGLAACGGGEDEASIEERLEEKGTVEVMVEAGKAEYDPPADGRLSEAQVEQYIEIQERAAKIRLVAKKKLDDTAAETEEASEGGNLWNQVREIGDAMKGFGDMMTAEIRAAQELGYNPAEYQWVKEQVVEAMGASVRSRGQESIRQSMEELASEMETQLQEIEDPERRAQMEERIKSVRETEVGDGELDPSVTANVELVQRYEEEILAAWAAYEEEEA